MKSCVEKKKKHNRFLVIYHRANDFRTQQNMQSKNPEALQGKRQQTNTDVIHLPQRGTKKK